jgi:transposase
MQRLPIRNHLTPAEIARRYRTCPEGGEKSRWQVLWLLTRTDGPLRPAQAARTVGFTPGWARAVLKRYNAHGPDGLADRRRDNGAAPKLSPAQQAELYAALHQEAPDGGLWTGPKVARYVRDRFGVTACPQTGWRWLKRLGFRLVVPRPRHPKAATDGEQRRWL